VVAETAIRDSVRGFFAGLVPPEVIDAYDQLLASNGCAKDQAEELVGDAGLVEALTGWGMAHVQPHTPADPAWLRPASPDLALQGVLAGHQGQLVRDQELLLDGHRRLAEAQARFGVGMNGRFPEHLVAVISDRAQISELSASLVNTAHKDWMTLENLTTEMPLTQDFAQPPLPASAGQVRCRSIYDASPMDDPVARQIIDVCADAGEQARLLPKVPMKMKLADHTPAMLPLTPAGTAGALLIRAPLIISALREYFELLWERATPLRPQHPAPPSDRLTPAQQAVLELMAKGWQDHNIAQETGTSTTTVRRHIAAIMRRLSVCSRFAAGAAAQRKGWIG
jgi:DNA-binding CsgD family transcriptional regulator